MIAVALSLFRPIVRVPMSHATKGVGVRLCECSVCVFNSIPTGGKTYNPPPCTLSIVPPDRERDVVYFVRCLSRTLCARIARILARLPGERWAATQLDPSRSNWNEHMRTYSASFATRAVTINKCFSWHVHTVSKWEDMNIPLSLMCVCVWVCMCAVLLRDFHALWTL